MIKISCSVNTEGLELGIKAAREYNGRTMPQAVNTALYSVAIAARDSTRFVTQERIDTDLGVAVTLRLSKRGKRFLRDNRTKILTSGRTVTIEEKEVPLAAAIIAARAKPGSKYNKLTANRWAMTKNPFAGVTRSEGRAAMAALVHRMISARHSSTKYLLAGWLPSISILFQFVKHKFQSTRSGQRRHGKINFNLGTATPASEGAICSGSIENSVGVEGKTGPKANEALLLYGMEALQKAVDDEGEKSLAYAMRKMEEETAKVVQPFWR